PCSVVCFVFSSRRRHTRSKRDWSSDVCSSDLCCLSMTVALWRQRKGCGGRGHLFPRIAIHTVARYCAKAFFLGLAIQPVGEKGTDHMITHRELSHSFTHCNHLSGTIGHGNAVFTGTPQTADYRKIMVVQ